MLRPLGSIPTLRGLLPHIDMPRIPEAADPYLIFNGRHIPEKQVPAIIAALSLARQRQPNLRAVLVGNGPDLDSTRRAIREAALESCVDLPGFVDEDVLRETLRRALCLVLLSRREGYGLVVAEAAAVGVPSVVLRHEDSAAHELIVEGVNGVLCESSEPSVVASAILRIHDAGHELRQSTLDWSRDHARELSIEGSLPQILALYRGEIPQDGSAY